MLDNNKKIACTVLDFNFIICFEKLKVLIVEEQKICLKQLIWLKWKNIPNSALSPLWIFTYSLGRTPSLSFLSIGLNENPKYTCPFGKMVIPIIISMQNCPRKDTFHVDSRFTVGILPLLVGKLKGWLHNVIAWNGMCQKRQRKFLK